MGRPRLGIGFEGTLYGERLPAMGLPELGHVSPTLMTDGLVAAANRYELVIYPLRPDRDDTTAALRAWVLFQLERHFEAQRYDRPSRLALALVAQIDFADDRTAGGAVDLAIEVGGFPRAEDLERIDALIAPIMPVRLSA